MVNDSMASLKSRQQEPQARSEADRAALSKAHEMNLTVLNLFRKGEYAEAEKIAKKVLEIVDSLSKPDLETTGAATTNMAEICFALKKYSDAERHQERTLRLRKELLGESNKKVLDTLDRLGTFSNFAGHNDKAETYMLEALHTREKVNGEQSLEVGQSCYRLGEFYRFQNQLNKAEPMYQRAISIFEKVDGPKNSNLISTLNGYADIMVVLNRKDEAERMRQRVVTLASGGLLNGRATFLPAPVYPLGARELHVSGVVTVQVTIDETGKVIKAVALDGPELLRQAAVDAARKARFSPTRVAGKPIPVTGVIKFNFLPPRN
jgi:TonB family protein